MTDPGTRQHYAGRRDAHTGVAMCTSEGKQIPCVTDHGVWFSSHQCYAQPMQPQPSPDSPAWQGHSPDEGQVWVCSVYPGPVTGGYWFFVANGDVPALVDPGDMAANAVGQLPLAVPVVHLAPGPPHMTYVGLETWLWMDPSQWQDLSLTVTAGGTSVTVLAHPVRVTWDLTEGSVVCASAGRMWDAEWTATNRLFIHVRRSGGPPAGRSLRRPATLTYDVSWTCSGACMEQSGSLGEVDGLPGLRRSRRRTAVRRGRRLGRGLG